MVCNHLRQFFVVVIVFCFVCFVVFFCYANWSGSKAISHSSHVSSFVRSV